MEQHRTRRGVSGGFQLQVLQNRDGSEKRFSTSARQLLPVHTVHCMCVPPWPVPWATWHSAELSHATRVASHRVRAQITQSSPPAADGDWSTQPALPFCSLVELHGPAHTTPTCWAHAPHCGACAQHVSFFWASPWRAGSMQNCMRVGGSVGRQGQILDFE